MVTIRRAGTTSAAVLSGLVAALGLAHAAAPEWARGLDLDIWNAPESRALLRASAERRGQLDVQQSLLSRQIEAADHLATSLAAGLVTLADAADACEPLLRDRDGFMTASAVQYRTSSFRHSVCRYLIDRVKLLLMDDPARSDVVMKQLEAEYSSIR